VPVHSLGISQIIAYGLMFYVFALLKTPLAVNAGVEESQILAALTGCLLMQAMVAPAVGGLVDRLGALWVMARGFFLGAMGMCLLPLVHSFTWIVFCMIPIGIAFAMTTYEIAFGAAVQMNEPRARRNISYITFYGGVASSITWISVAPLLAGFGLVLTCVVIASILLTMGLWALRLDRSIDFRARRKKDEVMPFRWSAMSRGEKIALITLASSSAFEYLVFAGTTLLWINWFSQQFGAETGVLLASLYGPFQVVGRLIEMKFGHRFDARYTGVIAFAMIPLSVFLAQSAELHHVIIAMMMFGMGHGILTVSFGYVTNMYFRAEVYGRAKGWITTPRALGNAIGPSVGGMLFLMGSGIYFKAMILFSGIAGLVFLFLLLVKPGNIISEDEA